jgi:hypothetical protein
MHIACVLMLWLWFVELWHISLSHVEYLWYFSEHFYEFVLYADDTSFIISNPSPIEFASKVNKIFIVVNEWFRNNLLSPNLDKTTYLQFRTKNSQIPDSNIILLNNQITSSRNTTFLGLTIEETLSWKCHINQVLSRLSSACYALRLLHLLCQKIP